MENKALIDTNVFVALFNKSDALHTQAKTCWEDLRTKKTQLYITDFIISEVLTVLRLKTSKEAALTFGDIVLNKTKTLHILNIGKDDMRDAYKIFRDTKVKNFSFVDVTIIALARTNKLKIISFDKQLQKTAKNT